MFQPNDIVQIVSPGSAFNGHLARVEIIYHANHILVRIPGQRNHLYFSPHELNKVVESSYEN